MSKPITKTSIVYTGLGTNIGDYLVVPHNFAFGIPTFTTFRVYEVSAPEDELTAITEIDGFIRVEQNGTTPANGTFIVEIDVPADVLVRELTNGNTFTADTIRDLMIQGAMLSGAVAEGRLATLATSLDFGNNKAFNLADGVDPQDSVNKRQLDAVAAVQVPIVEAHRLAAELAQSEAETAQTATETARDETIAAIAQAEITGVSDGDKGDITASNGGDTWEINAGAVGTAEIATGAVTANELAVNAVASANIQDASVEYVHLSDDAKSKLSGIRTFTAGADSVALTPLGIKPDGNSYPLSEVTTTKFAVSSDSLVDTFVDSPTAVRSAVDAAGNLLSVFDKNGVCSAVVTKPDNTHSVAVTLPSSGSAQDHDVQYDPVHDRFLVVYSRGANTAYYALLSFDGTAITVETSGALTGFNYVTLIEMAYSAQHGKHVAAVWDQNAGQVKLTSFACTATTVTQGATQTVASENVIDLGFDGADSEFLLVYFVDGAPASNRTRACDFDGTTFTIPTATDSSSFPNCADDTLETITVCHLTGTLYVVVHKTEDNDAGTYKYSNSFAALWDTTSGNGSLVASQRVAPLARIRSVKLSDTEVAIVGGANEFNVVQTLTWDGTDFRHFGYVLDQGGKMDVDYHDNSMYLVMYSRTPAGREYNVVRKMTRTVNTDAFIGASESTVLSEGTHDVSLLSGGELSYPSAIAGDILYMNEFGEFSLTEGAYKCGRAYEDGKIILEEPQLPMDNECVVSTAQTYTLEVTGGGIKLPLLISQGKCDYDSASGNFIVQESGMYECGFTRIDYETNGTLQMYLEAHDLGGTLQRWVLGANDGEDTGTPVRVYLAKGTPVRFRVAAATSARTGAFSSDFPTMFYVNKV